MSIDLHAALERSIDSGSSRLVSLRAPDGGWNAEMVWCPALTATYAIAHRAVGRPLDASDGAAVLRQFDRWQLPDGSWGLHPASGGYLYATVLCHVAQRLLGRPPEDAACEKALRWIHRNGGPVRAPVWAKAWLSIAGLYGWEGLPPLPPELFRVPESLPIHPSRMYCHTRMIYLALSVLRALRWTMPEDDLVRSIRSELFPQGLADARIEDHRYDVSPTDLYVEPGRVLRGVYGALGSVERAVPASVRASTVSMLVEEIRYEQRVTGQAAISPVSGLMNVVALHAADPADPAAGEALDGMRIWRWQDESEGLRLAGARSHAWDTSFALQALAAGPRPTRFRDAFRLGSKALGSYRITGDPPDRERHWRSSCRGGWGFDDGSQRWPVSDCAAEALEALRIAEPLGGETVAPDVRLDAVRFILSRADRSGGFSSYEERRGARWLERLNPSEMFDDCMIDRPYVECTASCLRALAGAAPLLPTGPEARRTAEALRRGVRFLLSEQRDDGSWPGAWGVWGTYAAFHVVPALRAAGLRHDHPAIRRARTWLEKRQRPDGSWGEDWTSSPRKSYVPAAEGSAVQTAWAMLALDAAGSTAEDAPMSRAARWLAGVQAGDGSWIEPQPTGVFMSTSLVYYRLYPAVFPLWALGRFARSAPAER